MKPFKIYSVKKGHRWGWVVRSQKNGLCGYSDEFYFFHGAVEWMQHLMKEAHQVS